MGFKPKTFIDLCSAMKTGALVTIDTYDGYISSIEKEDGSGYNWNITLRKANGDYTNYEIVFFREDH